ncbi:MAG TPA: helix-turn-helix domain-containing protein [Anaerolineae bacterium]|nr:helix-turn-helix domain-containing protein [Caldilineae bacterium]HID33582.1 helix-turn-helix domain-containing protein [Anaerolineae bacterium]HIQ11808.1 helix-turn-helix domain-containing protein [Caldilineales bacterium]
MTRWLTLSAASKLLGVHPATLRQWADAGKIPSFRTPGGHRRFRAEDLRRFLVQASHAAPQDALATEDMLLTTALVETRRDLQQSPPSEQSWYSKFDEEGMARQRVLGRSLFEKAIRYLTLEEARPIILEESRELGRAYAHSSLRYDISLLDTVRAFQFFRQKLYQSLVSDESGAGLATADNARFRADFDAFFDEVLFGLIETYERQLLDQKVVIEQRPADGNEPSLD